MNSQTFFGPVRGAGLAGDEKDWYSDLHLWSPIMDRQEDFRSRPGMPPSCPGANEPGLRYRLLQREYPRFYETSNQTFPASFDQPQMNADVHRLSQEQNPFLSTASIRVHLLKEAVPNCVENLLRAADDLMGFVLEHQLRDCHWLASFDQPRMNADAHRL